MKKFAIGLMLTAAPVAALAQGALKSTPAPAAPIPVGVFGQHATLENPVISTDGKYLAAKVRSNGEKVLSIVPLVAGEKPIPIAKDGEFGSYGDRRIVGWRWIDGDNLLITLAQYTDIDGDKTDILRSVNFNRKTRKMTPIGWDGSFYSTRTLWVSKSGPPRVLVQRLAAGQGTERISNPEVIEVDVATGKTKIVQRRNPIVQSWAVDGSGTVRMGSGGDGNTGKQWVIYRPNGSANFSTIAKETAKKYESGTPVPNLFLADGKTGVTMTNKDGFYEIYEIDLATMKLGKKLYSAKGYDAGGYLSNREGNAIEGFYHTEGKSQVSFVEPRLKELKQVLDQTFGKDIAAVVSSDVARENLIVHVGDTNQVGAYYLYQTTTGDLKRIGYVNETLKDMALNPVRSIRYKASDGKEIHAVLTLPRLKQAKALPLIVLPHGGPWSRDEERFDLWAQPLAELGYAVVQPNFRGSTGFGKDWEAASDGNWGMRMQDDLLDAITHLAGQGIADSKRVCIMGWSYGGYAASRAAQRDGKHYRCSITGAGVHDLPDMVAYDKNYLGEYGSKYIGEAAKDLIAVSPARNAAQFSIPTLIVHGKKDDRVPVAQSRKLVSRLKAAGKVEGRDFEYLEQPENTHHFPHEKDMVQFLERVKSFLDKHNPA